RAPPYHSCATSTQPCARAHDAPQSFCRFASAIDFMSAAITRKRTAPFPEHRRNSARPWSRCDVTPRLQHHLERARENYPHNRSSPAKDENSYPCQRWRIRLRGVVELAVMANHGESRQLVIKLGGDFTSFLIALGTNPFEHRAFDGV